MIASNHASRRVRRLTSCRRARPQAGKAKGNLVARNDAQAHVFRSGEKGLNLRRGILLHQLGENVDVEQVRPNHASELSSAKGSPLSPDGGGNSMSEPRGAVARRNCPICRIARTRSNSVDETTRHGSCAPIICGSPSCASLRISDNFAFASGAVQTAASCGSIVMKPLRSVRGAARLFARLDPPRAGHHAGNPPVDSVRSDTAPSPSAGSVKSMVAEAI